MVGIWVAGGVKKSQGAGIPAAASGATVAQIMANSHSQAACTVLA